MLAGIVDKLLKGEVLSKDESKLVKNIQNKQTQAEKKLLGVRS